MRALFFGLLISLAALYTPASAAADTVRAPGFTLTSAAGETVTLPRRHEGVDIYLFWATWCPYCKALMPHLQSILDEYGDQVRVYALNIREDGDPQAYLQSQGYDFVLLPEADAVARLYGAKSTPGIFVVDGQGMVRLNLYELITSQEPGFADLNNRQKAARRGPWWGAKIRQAVDEVLNRGS